MMDKKPLIIACLCAVILLVLGSLSNVVGYQTVQSSYQQSIKEKVNQRELVFQTICDITNNKEIQRIILKSQMSRGIFSISEIPVITKQQLRQMYFIGLILSKFISKSRIQSIVGKYQLIKPEVQQEIQVVIEKDAILKDEITQLQNSECDCENETTSSDFPIICILLFPLINILAYLFFIGYIINIYILENLPWYPTIIYRVFGIIYVISEFFFNFGDLFNCWWYPSWLAVGIILKLSK